MKRILFCIIFVSALLLSACQNTDRPQSTYNGLNAWYSDTHTTQCYSIEEYQNFLPKSDSIRDFVSYNQISVLGSFHSFYYWPPGGKYPEYYTYNVKDTNNRNLSISMTINPGNDNLSRLFAEKARLLSLPEGMTDMLHLVGCEAISYVYTRHGLDYHYLQNGKLHMIVWTENDVRYQLNNGGVLANDFSMDGEETIMHRLLSIDENVSKAAFEELKAHMKANS